MQFVCSCRRYFRDGISGGRGENGGGGGKGQPMAPGGEPRSAGVALCMGSRDTRNNGSTYTHAGRLYTQGHIRRGKLTAEQFQWGLVTTPAVIVPTIIIYCSSMAPTRSRSKWEGIKSSTILFRQVIITLISIR